MRKQNDSDNDDQIITLHLKERGRRREGGSGVAGLEREWNGLGEEEDARRGVRESYLSVS